MAIAAIFDQRPDHLVNKAFIPTGQESIEDITLKKTNKIQKEQLARSAATITIQAYTRGWQTKKRYLGILNAFLSTRTHVDPTLNDSQLPSIQDLRLQVNYI
jgi:hypothetical protein